MPTDNVAESELEKELANVAGDNQQQEQQGTVEQEATFEVPKKFQGKSEEEVIQSYLELEKELGRKGNEIGELRKLTDTLIHKSLAETTKPVESTPKVEEAEFDFDDPVRSVDSRVANNPRLKELENRVIAAERASAVKDFESKHPDYQEINTDPAFQKWIADSKYRTQMYARADVEFDFDAADEILNLWKEHAQVADVTAAKAEKQVRKDKALNAAATVTTTTGGTSDKIFRRADIIKLKMEDPERYKSLGEEIKRAYIENRVR